MLLRNLSMIMKPVSASSNSIRHTVAYVIVKILQKLPWLGQHCTLRTAMTDPGNLNRAAFLRNKYSLQNFSSIESDTEI